MTNRDAVAAFAAMPERKQRASLAVALSAEDIPGAEQEGDEDGLAVTQRILGMARQFADEAGMSQPPLHFISTCMQVLEAEHAVREGSTELNEAAPAPVEPGDQWDSLDDATYLAGLHPSVRAQVVGLMLRLKRLDVTELESLGEWLNSSGDKMEAQGHEDTASFMRAVAGVLIADSLERRAEASALLRELGRDDPVPPA